MITRSIRKFISKMKLFPKVDTIGLMVIGIALVAAPAAVFAQTDEIQVYDAEIEAHDKFNVEVHSNFTPIGRKTPDFPGGIIPNRSVNGGVEWAYGVADWFEQGLYLPVYTAYSDGRGGSIDGFKLRELFVRPHAHDQTFFYGVNFEFSVNYKYWESKRIYLRGSAHRRMAPASGGHHLQSGRGY